MADIWGKEMIELVKEVGEIEINKKGYLMRSWPSYPSKLTCEHTYDSQHSTGRVMVQGGVHDAGVGALVSIGHVHDSQSICINHKPESITVLEV